MKDQKEYIKLPLSVRQEHLDLKSDCLERGGTSQHHKGVLAHALGTAIHGKPVDLCHACHNPKCSNPYHLYWGTRSENVKDSIANGTYKTPFEHMKEKYGEDVAKELFRKKAKEAHSKRYTPQHKGTIFVNNGEISKRILKNSPIPEGWKKGRVKFKTRWD